MVKGGGGEDSLRIKKKYFCHLKCFFLSPRYNMRIEEQRDRGTDRQRGRGTVVQRNKRDKGTVEQ